MKRNTVVDLGAWLRDLRKTRGKTLREVAAAAGMDPALLSKIECGNRVPTLDQTSALARGFGVSEPDMQARRIAVDFVARYGRGEGPRKALTYIRLAFKQHEAQHVH